MVRFFSFLFLTQQDPKHPSSPKSTLNFLRHKNFRVSFNPEVRFTSCSSGLTSYLDPETKKRLTFHLYVRLTIQVLGIDFETQTRPPTPTKRHSCTESSKFDLRLQSKNDYSKVCLSEGSKLLSSHSFVVSELFTLTTNL